jgi:hypothetical protein
MQTIKKYSTVHVKMLTGRIRHMVIETVTNQNTISGRVGSNTNGVAVNATRAASTTTRGKQFNQV